MKLMAKNNRVFISFAVEDRDLFAMLSGQAKSNRTPFEFVNMGVKQPWDEQWKTNCRSRIKGCDGVVVLVTRNTAKAEGALWEIKCAKEEKLPILGVYGASINRPTTVPSELAGVRVVDWTWPNIATFVNGL